MVAEIRKWGNSLALRIPKALTHDPRPGATVKLKGLVEFYRIQAGDYRVIYLIHLELRGINCSAPGSGRLQFPGL